MDHRSLVASTLSRRNLLLGGTAAGASVLLSGCIGSSPATPAGEAGGNTSTTLTLQSSLSDPGPKAALEAVIKDYSKSTVTLNTVAIEQFRAQLPTYLTSGNPPDVLTWYAGSVARDYASKGLLLDLSDMWAGDGACANFSPALKKLSSNTEGDKQIFVPTSYYWWSIFYRKSAFEKWDVKPPTSWDDFMGLLEKLKGKGVSPLTNGTGSTPWMASGWFDYLDLRINGAEFHRDLLAGKHAFDSAEVRKVMETYATLVPFFDPKGTSYSWQEAATPLANKKAGMYLIGAFITSALPADTVDDLDFFSVPTIDPSVPSAEEAPTDGFFASAKSDNVSGAKELLGYLASPQEQQAYIEAAGSSNLPTSPDVDSSKFSPLVQKGIKLLEETQEITQFFNRDSSDALQSTADAALTRFLDNPDDIASILKNWQSAAEQVWNQ